MNMCGNSAIYFLESKIALFFFKRTTIIALMKTKPKYYYIKYVYKLKNVYSLWKKIKYLH